MKMRRKGFLAALAGMVAAPVALLLPKGKAEAKFPRWFRSTALRRHYPNCLYVARSPKVVESLRRVCAPRFVRSRIWPDRLWHHPVLQRGPLDLRLMDLQDCLAMIDKGYWREITAAEAEALLKPKGSWTPEPWPGPASAERVALQDFPKDGWGWFFTDWSKISLDTE